MAGAIVGSARWAASRGDDAKEAAYDAICEQWYLGDEAQDGEALRTLLADVARLEALVGIP